MTYYRKANDVEFDHVFTIMSGGTITDGPAGIHAPESNDETLSDPAWSYWSTGRSGQDRYRGPIMHASEYIGGSFERDLMSEPGIYAVVVDYASPDDDDDDNASGWAVVRHTGTLPTRGRYIGVWHGGHSYSHGEWTDAEWFGTLSDAADAIRDRENGGTYAPTFRYVVRDDDRTLTPCAHSEWSGSIMLYRVTDSVSVDDVRDMIENGYPDRCVRFGPRGGIRIETT